MTECVKAANAMCAVGGYARASDGFIIETPNSILFYHDRQNIIMNSLFFRENIVRVVILSCAVVCA